MQSLALTFDDGPDGRHTPLLLDLLRAARVTATFFLIAPRAAEHPAVIQRILDEGHAIGVHCHQHLRHSARDRSWCRQDTDLALGRLRGLGADPVLWRTPWGDLAPWSEQVARERGLRLVGWTVDTHDWRGDSAEEMFSATRPSLTDGAIVLAHDGIGPGARRRSVEETIGYVRLVIEHALGRGIRLRSLA